MQEDKKEERKIGGGSRKTTGRIKAALLGIAACLLLSLIPSKEAFADVSFTFTVVGTTQSSGLIQIEFDKSSSHHLVYPVGQNVSATFATGDYVQNMDFGGWPQYLWCAGIHATNLGPYAYPGARGTITIHHGGAYLEEHSWQWTQTVGATCTAAAQGYYTCSKCGYRTNGTSGSALGHSSTAKLVAGATCTTAAVYHDTCNRCGVETRGNYNSGKALGHDWKTATASANKGLRTGATCTAAATYYKYCSRDGNHSDTNQWNTVGSALGHAKSGNLLSSTPANCTTQSTEVWKCVRYGSGGCAQTYTEHATAALGHAWTDATAATNKGLRTAATCLDAATYYKYCARDGNHFDANQWNAVGERLGHVWNDGVVTTEPTVYETGIRTFTCTRDGSHVATGIEPKLQFEVFVGTARIEEIDHGDEKVMESYTGTDRNITNPGTAPKPDP